MPRQPTKSVEPTCTGSEKVTLNRTGEALVGSVLLLCSVIAVTVGAALSAERHKKTNEATPSEGSEPARLPNATEAVSPEARTALPAKSVAVPPAALTSSTTEPDVVTTTLQSTRKC